MERVIIYRSQTEAELDKLLWSSDGKIFEIGVLCLIWVFVFVNLYRAWETHIKRNGRGRFNTTVAGFVCGSLAGGISLGIGVLLKKLLLFI